MSHSTGLDSRVDDLPETQDHEWKTRPSTPSPPDGQDPDVACLLTLLFSRQRATIWWPALFLRATGFHAPHTAGQSNSHYCHLADEGYTLIDECMSRASCSRSICQSSIQCNVRLRSESSDVLLEITANQWNPPT